MEGLRDELGKEDGGGWTVGRRAEVNVGVNYVNM